MNALERKGIRAILGTHLYVEERDDLLKGFALDGKAPAVVVRAANREVVLNSEEEAFTWECGPLSWVYAELSAEKYREVFELSWSAGEDPRFDWMWIDDFARLFGLSSPSHFERHAERENLELNEAGTKARALRPQGDWK